MDTDSNKSLSSKEFCSGGGDVPISHSYFAPVVISELHDIAKRSNRVFRVFDLGCGNGTFSEKLAHEGYDVVACDHRVSGVQIAQKMFPQIQFFS